MWMSGGSLMSEGGEARTFICDVCGERLPDDVVIEHYCVEGGEARNHEAEVERVPRAPHGIRQRDFRMGWEAALDAVRRSPQGEAPRAIELADGRAMPLPRSPQGEEHEPCATCAPMQCDCDDGPVQGGTTERLRSSPEREPTRLGTVCEQCERRTMEPVYTEDGDVFCGRCAVQLAPFPERNTEKLVERIASWLQHIDRLDEIPGAREAMPQYNPLWDAAEAIRIEFSDASKEA